MRCDVCGLDYGLSHNCPGPLSQEILDAGLQAPANAGMGYYLSQAWKIVRWDEIAIRRNARDQRATMYALLLWIAAMLIVLLVASLPRLLSVLTRAKPFAMVIGAIVGITFGLIMMASITFAQLALCHLIAKWFFGATGKFPELMRPLLLGWWVNCLAVIPVVGILLAGIGWTAVLMMVFEEVDGIERLQAFGISAGINLCVFAIQFWLMPVTHHL